ncbi:hypothetical protein LX36DRAFT_209993 [Colletotrichum falcatum]|nr:hypothetical protein LX36DRAFT_209993 [Colletotrichum falcatum]
MSSSPLYLVQEREQHRVCVCVCVGNPSCFLVLGTRERNAENTPPLALLCLRNAHPRRDAWAEPLLLCLSLSLSLSNTHPHSPSPLSHTKPSCFATTSHEERKALARAIHSALILPPAGPCNRVLNQSWGAFPLYLLPPPPAPIPPLRNSQPSLTCPAVPLVCFVSGGRWGLAAVSLGSSDLCATTRARGFRL